MKYNLYKYLLLNKNNYPKKTAIIHEGNTVNYKELIQLIDEQEYYLVKNLNIKSGDRIAILSYNRLEYITLFYACAKIGSILVTLNWRLTNFEINKILNNVKPKALFLEKILSNNSYNEIENLRIIDLDSNFGLCNLPNYQKSKSIKKDLRNNPLLIVYTSGTTGESKGAVITQKALYYNNLNSIHMHKFNKNDKILTVLPLFHVGGLNIQTIPALHIGASVILTKKFDLEQTIKVLNKYKPNYTVLVPTIMELFTKTKNWKANFLSLKAITTGSTIVSTKLIKTYEQNNIPIIQVYGSTETCPIAICQNIKENRLPYGNTGKPALRVKIGLFNKNDKNKKNPNYGEIKVKGLNLFSKYWKNQNATKKAFKNGWFMTGDIARKNKFNQYFILGRNTDVIISGGENIYPAEVEQIINQENNVYETAVIGVTHSKWQEIPIAFIKVSKNKYFSEQNIMKNMQLKLAKYKIPKKLIRIDEIPKNALGKIDYKILKEYYKTLKN